MGQTFQNTVSHPTRKGNRCDREDQGKWCASEFSVGDGDTFWGVGDMYFGNINRTAGTMSGVVLDDQGNVYSFVGVHTP